MYTSDCLRTLIFIFLKMKLLTSTLISIINGEPLISSLVRNPANFKLFINIEKRIDLKGGMGDAANCNVFRPIYVQKQVH